ncbi:MAG: nucleotidyltransferase domain-containing protein [Synergistaceae bacterium]|nr:nucleotidyltransferase domain-containing protein [Synergistaceae bacterium]
MTEITYPERKTLNDTEMFDDVVRGILSVMGDDVIKIILYGSVARGDNTWESDVDIAVITSRHYRLDERLKTLTDLEVSLMYEYGVMFEIVPIEQKRFNEWLFDLPFYFNIDEEGLLLWTKENGRIYLDTALKERMKKLP